MNTSDRPRMSKQDSHFMTVFSLVIGILFAISVLFFALSRAIAGRTQDVEVYSDPDYVASVKQRVQPFAREAVSGQNNAGLKIATAAGSSGAGAGVALAMPKNGKQVFQMVCSACHGTGVAGAPKAGDKAAWAPHLAKGMTVLYDHALHGFHGSAGVMPAKGGRPDLSDALVKAGVNYMVSLVRK